MLMQRSWAITDPPAVVRASGYGMVSSSCSYAASAMAKSLFVKGADFIAAMVFMFASTNLVIELGIVLIVLMGWQFAVSEFVGGIIMIVLLATLGALWLRGRQIVEARERLTEGNDDAEHQHGPAENRHSNASRGRCACVPWPAGRTAPPTRCPISPCCDANWSSATRWPASWPSSCPTSVWQAVFISGHGFWTSLENVIVGPFIAIISFVCSIGNVPLAAALWNGGISFGGVISFIFADLIAFPLLHDLPPLLRHPPHAAHAGGLLGRDVDGRA